MENPKYETVLSILESKFFEAAPWAVAQLMHHMMDKHKEDGYVDAERFSIDVIPATKRGFVGIRLQWGRGDGKCK